MNETKSPFPPGSSELLNIINGYSTGTPEQYIAKLKELKNKPGIHTDVVSVIDAILLRLTITNG